MCLLRNRFVNGLSFSSLDIEDLSPNVQEKLFDEVLDRDVQKGNHNIQDYDVFLQIAFIHLFTLSSKVYLYIFVSVCVSSNSWCLHFNANKLQNRTETTKVSNQDCTKCKLYGNKQKCSQNKSIKYIRHPSIFLWTTYIQQYVKKLQSRLNVLTSASLYPWRLAVKHMTESCRKQLWQTGAVLHRAGRGVSHHKLVSGAGHTSG